MSSFDAPVWGHQHDVILVHMMGGLLDSTSVADNFTVSTNSSSDSVEHIVTLTLIQILDDGQITELEDIASIALNAEEETELELWFDTIAYDEFNDGISTFLCPHYFQFRLLIILLFSFYFLQI